MPRKFKSALTTNTAKRNGVALRVWVNPHIRAYVEYRATAESKTITQILISIITKEIANDKFYKK